MGCAKVGAALVAVLFAALVAGCGSSGSSGVSAGTYVKSICTAVASPMELAVGQVVDVSASGFCIKSTTAGADPCAALRAGATRASVVP